MRDLERKKGEWQGPSNRPVSGRGEKLDILVDKPFMGRFPCCNFLTIDMLPKKLNKIPTTTRNQLV